MLEINAVFDSNSAWCQEKDNEVVICLRYKYTAGEVVFHVVLAQYDSLFVLIYCVMS